MVAMTVKPAQPSALMLSGVARMCPLGECTDQQLIRWVMRGLPIRVHRGEDGKSMALSGDTGGAIVLHWHDDEDIRSVLMGNGWKWNRRRCVYQGIKVARGREMTWTTNRALIERLQNRRIDSIGELEDVLESVCRILDSLGSWLAPEANNLTRTDKAELLAELPNRSARAHGRRPLHALSGLSGARLADTLHHVAGAGKAVTA